MRMLADNLTKQERCLLDELQSGLSIEKRPFISIGQKVNMKEAEVLLSVSNMLQSGLIRRLGGIFDSNALGYVSTLAAARVIPGELDAVADVISAEPGVTHNYSRNHEFNLWFTLTLSSKKRIIKKLSQWELLPGVERILNLPATKLFKIGVKFNFSENKKPLQQQRIIGGCPNLLTIKEKAVVRALYQLPLTAEVYKDAGRSEGLTEEEFLAAAAALSRKGALRRVAAIVRHREAGFASNAMAAWLAPGSKAEEAGRIASECLSVSHVYLRQTHPEWPYNLYTMIHAATKEECCQTAEAISLQTGIDNYKLLFTDKEYKKTSMQYFRS